MKNLTPLQSILVALGIVALINFIVNINTYPMVSLLSLSVTLICYISIKVIKSNNLKQDKQ